ncbi:MAG TPA: hypothetical protein VI386_29390 [Candidatus Sulfotelmatobacter sp.]
MSSLSSVAADSPVRATLDISKAGPRAVEAQTQQSVLRDYRLAWSSIAQALLANTLDPLEATFTGEAKRSLIDEVNAQRRSGLSSRYDNQDHKVQAVFYGPEGDVIELHDTAEYQLQIMDGSKGIHDQHVVIKYVVLMTPAADRWVVRHLQAVPEF